MSGDRHALGERREKPCDYGHNLIRLPFECRRAGGEECLLLQSDHQPLFGQLRRYLILQIVFLYILLDLLLRLTQILILLHIGIVRIVLTRGCCRVDRRRRSHAGEERRPSHIECRCKRLCECLHLRGIRLRHCEQSNEEGEQQRHQIGIGQKPGLARFLLMGFRVLLSRHISRLPSEPRAPSAG